MGDSSFYQNVTIPDGGILYFWYWMFSQDSIRYDWQDVYITDLSGNILSTIFHRCDNGQTWLQQTYDLSAFAGQRVRLKFLVHQDGSGGTTAMFIDDVSILTPADFIIPALKGTLVIKHPALKQIVLYDPAGNILFSESGLTDLASGVITISKSWTLDLAVGTANVEVTTADGRVHRIPL